MQKTIVNLVVLFTFVVLQPKASFAALIKVSDHVYSYADTKDPSPANSFGANAGVIVTDEGLIVIDTLISAKEAQRFIADIKEISNQPFKYAVNTHYHLDHSFGNAEFKKLGAVIISQEKDRGALAEKGEEILKDASTYGLTPEEMEGTEIAVPSLSFEKAVSIELGGVLVKLIYAGPSHSKGSLMVYVPQEKVLFAGDILFTDYHPYMADGVVAGWLTVLDYISTLDVTAIVPGHGPLSTQKDIADMKDYLLAFDTKARELAKKKATPEELAVELKAALPVRSWLDWVIAVNLKALYLPEAKAE